MKKYTIVCLLAIALLCGCNNEPTDQQAGNLGKMRFSHSRIGVGQAVTVMVKELEAPVGTVTGRSMTWILNGRKLVSDENRFDDGFYSRVVYPNQEGENTLTLDVDYIFKVQGADGLQIRKSSVTTAFEAQACDVRTSFWGDTIAEVTRNEYHCTLQPLAEDLYFGTYKPIYYKPLYVYYHFSEGALDYAEEKQYNTLTAMNDYATFVTSFLVFKDTLDSWYNQGNVSDLAAQWQSPTPQETAAWESFKASYDAGERKFISVDDERLMGSAMASGRLVLSSDYVTGAHTVMRLFTEPCTITAETAVFFTQRFDIKPSTEEVNE